MLRKVKMALEIPNIFGESDNILLQTKQFGKRKDYVFCFLFWKQDYPSQMS